MNDFGRRFTELIKRKDGYFSSELYIVGIIVLLFVSYAISRFFMNKVEFKTEIGQINFILTNEIKAYIFFGITVVALITVLIFCITRAKKMNR